jgi:hypothetical protein
MTQNKGDCELDQRDTRLVGEPSQLLDRVKLALVGGL